MHSPYQLFDKNGDTMTMNRVASQFTSLWIPILLQLLSIQSTITSTTAFTTSTINTFSHPTFLPLTSKSTSFSHLQMSDSAAATTTTSSAKGEDKPKIITISYDLTPQENYVPIPLFEHTGKGTSILLNGGNYLPAFHTLLADAKVGDSFTKVEMDAGWGSKRDDLIADIPIANLAGMDTSKIKVGVELMLANGMECRVVHVDDEKITIDANPPLAGASFLADLSVEGVEDGPMLEGLIFGEDFKFDSKYEVLTIALGCFWGGELEYMRIDGVVGTSVGYTQGEYENPTYKQVCSGTTGHTEAIQVVYNSDIVSYEELVKVGLERLNESRYLLNQVGNDRGTQYRHGVYYYNEEQKEICEKVVKSYGEKCVTETKPATIYYKAEDYHQQYLFKGGQSARKDAKEPIRCYG